MTARNTMTAVGFAKLIARAVRSETDRDPGATLEKLEELADRFFAWADYRDDDSEATSNWNRAQRAEQDSEWLQAVAEELQDIYTTSI